MRYAGGSIGSRARQPGRRPVLTRIVREPYAFVNNAPTGAAPPRLSVSTGRSRGLLKVSPERSPHIGGEVEAHSPDYSRFVNNPG